MPESGSPGQGFTTAQLWVLSGNGGAIRFYRIDGWAADGSRRREKIHGLFADEVRYGRRLP